MSVALRRVIRPERRARQRPAVQAYVYGLCLLAAAAAVVAARSVHSVRPAPPVVLALLVLLVVQAEALTVVYQYRGHVESINLVEVALAPVLFACDGLQLVAVVGLALAVAGMLHRNDPVKGLFNAAQWVLASSVAALVLDALRQGSAGSARNVLALIVAVLVAASVNQLAFAGVLRLVTGRALAPAGQRRHFLAARTIGPVSSLALGLLTAAAYTWSSLTLGAAVISLPLAHWASSAYAAVRADRRRLAGLQRATHVLAVSFDRTAALDAFLREVAEAFETDCAELVLFPARSQPDGSAAPAACGLVEVFSCSGSGCASRAQRTHALVPLLDGLDQPVRLNQRTARADLGSALAELDHAEAIVAPLSIHGRTAGLLCLYDRGGLGGFEEGELAVAAALAAEVVGFLGRCELVGQVMEEQRKLADIVESTSDGILMLDERGVIRSWNPGMAAITGYTAAEMVGAQQLAALAARDETGRPVHLERWADIEGDLPASVQVLTASGQPVWLSCSYSRIPEAEGRPPGLVVVARNVTQARELERLKEDFVAIVSHELRTPLAAIRGWSSTLLARGDRMSGEQRTKAVRSVLGQAQRLEQLVLNILEASRIEAGGSHDDSSPVDAAAAARRVVEELGAAHPGRLIRLAAPTAVPVCGPAVWVERAIANLVSNALKYSPDESPVDIWVERELVAGDPGGANVADLHREQAVVRVSDRGTGIPSESTERIFERFERLDSTTQTGTGLGLYITRELLRAMGGTVSCQSAVGQGSTFTIRLPAADTASQQTAAALPPQDRAAAVAHRR